MDKFEFTKKELIGILEIIEEARRCAGEEKLRELLLRAKDLVAADYAVCGMGAVRDGKFGLVTAINGNYPVEWLDLYQMERLYRFDPLVRYHVNFSMTQFWSDIFRRFVDSGARSAINRASDFGLRHGISSSVYLPELDGVSLLVFSSDKNRFEPHHKKILEILTLHLNNAVAKCAAAEAEKYDPEIYGKRLAL